MVRTALDIAIRKGDLKGQGDSYVQLGRLDKDAGYWKSAEENFRRALEIREMFDNMADVASVHNNLATVKHEEGAEEKALQHIKTAIRLYEQTTDTFGLVSTWNNYANIVRGGENYLDTAILFNNKTLALAQSDSFAAPRADAYFGLSKALALKSETDTARADSFLNRALLMLDSANALFEKLRYTSAQARAQNRLGVFKYEHTDTGDVALHLQNAINLYLQSKDTMLSAEPYYNLGHLHLGEGRYRKALETYKEGYARLKSTEAHKDKCDFALGIAEVFDSLEQPDSALFWQKLAFYWSQKRDSVNEATLNNALIYNLEDMRREVELEKNARTLTQLWWALGMLGLISLFFFFYKRKMHHIELEKKEAAHRAAIEQEEAKHLEALTRLIEESKETARSERLKGEAHEREHITRNLHDGVGSLILALKWHLESFQNTFKGSDEDREKIRQIFGMAELCYIELKKSVGLLYAGQLNWLETLRAFCVCVENINLLKINFKHFQIDDSISAETGDEIRLIVQELITNALKYAKAKSLNVSIDRFDDEISIVVEDNGIGFIPGANGSGNGLQNIRARVEKLGGTLNIDTGKGVGTSVLISLPRP